MAWHGALPMHNHGTDLCTLAPTTKTSTPTPNPAGARGPHDEPGCDPP